jgi:hypothetical protein
MSSIALHIRLSTAGNFFIWHQERFDGKAAVPYRVDWVCHWAV